MRKTILIFLLSALAFNVSAQQYTTPNVHGGENFYHNGQLAGMSMRNSWGGRNFYSMPGYNQGFQGYQGYGNPELQSGYAIGAGLANIINAFKGGGQ